MAFQATEQDQREYKECICTNDAMGKIFWSNHAMRLCALNDISNRFIKEIDELCDKKQLLNPIEVKRMIKAMWQEKRQLAKSVHFGLKALE